MSGKTITTAFVITAATLSLNTNVVFAQNYGTGGSSPKEMTINKEVLNPITNKYVENLTSTDPTFSPEGNVIFRFTIKNTTNANMTTITTVDSLPIYMSFVSAALVEGDKETAINGEVNKTDRTVTLKFDGLAAGATKTVKMTAKVDAKTAFPAGRSSFCLVNAVKTTSRNWENGDNDTAQFCLTVGAQTLPVAGFNDLLNVLPFLTLGGVGVALMKSKKN